MIPPLRRWFQEGGFKPAPVYRKNAYIGLPRRRRNGPEGRLPCKCAGSTARGSGWTTCSGVDFRSLA